MDFGGKGRALWFDLLGIKLFKTEKAKSTASWCIKEYQIERSGKVEK